MSSASRRLAYHRLAYSEIFCKLFSRARPGEAVRAWGIVIQGPESHAPVGRWSVVGGRWSSGTRSRTRTILLFSAARSCPSPSAWTPAAARAHRPGRRQLPTRRQQLPSCPAAHRPGRRQLPAARRPGRQLPVAKDASCPPPRTPPAIPASNHSEPSNTNEFLPTS